MTRAQLAIGFGVMFFIALILTLPLALFLPDRGLSARAARGTIWDGHLAEARVGRLALGDMDVTVNPFALLTGKVRATLAGPFGKGTLTNGRGISDATARIPTAALFAPIPLTAVDLDDVTAEFRSGRCERAEGRVRATFAGDVAGLSLAQGLSGTARCEGGSLLLPLVSQSAMERLNLRIAGDGSYKAEFVVKSTDPALAAKLSASGFASTQAGYVLRLGGSF